LKALRLQIELLPLPMFERAEYNFEFLKCLRIVFPMILIKSAFVRLSCLRDDRSRPEEDIICLSEQFEVNNVMKNGKEALHFRRKFSCSCIGEGKGKTWKSKFDTVAI